MIIIKDGKDYISQVRELITEYTRRLNRDLSFQNIEEELRLYRTKSVRRLRSQIFRQIG